MTEVKVPVFTDMIIPFSKVAPGDQLLHNDVFVLVELVKTTDGQPWGDGIYTRVDVDYRTDDGHRYSFDRRDDTLCAVRRQVISPLTYDGLRSMIAEGTHTAFRKATDHALAMPIHRLIGELPPAEWSNVVEFVTDPIWGAMVLGVDPGSFARSRHASS